MKIIKGCVLVLVGLILLILVLGLTVSKDFKVVRSINIPSAQKEILFDNIGSISHFLKWNPWTSKDPKLKIKLFGTQGKIGSGYAWRGNDEVGSGRLTLLSLDPHEKVRMELTFLDPFETTTTMIFTLLPYQEGHRVTWEMQGQSPYPFNALHIFMVMDHMVGPDFEKGLLNLKKKVEAESKMAK